MLRAYTVQPGDSLTGISFRIYGTMSRWIDILRANTGKIRNPDESAPNDPSKNVLMIGTELSLPGSSQVEIPSQVPATPPSSDSSSSILLLFGAGIVLYLFLKSKKGKRK